MDVALDHFVAEGKAMDETGKFLEVLLSWAWFGLGGFMLIRLFPTIVRIMESRGFTLKIAGQEVTVQETSEKFSEQIADLQNQVIKLREDATRARDDGPPAKVAVAFGEASNTPILWVDDNPKGNAWEISQLQQRGLTVIQAASTAEAFKLASSPARFRVIVSDMGRKEEGKFVADAGLQLLTQLRSAGTDVPFMIYTSVGTAERRRGEILAQGGDGATASPVELVEWIQRKLGPSPS